MRIPAHKLAFLVAGALTFFAAPVNAATTIYANFGDIKGEVTERNHQLWVQVISFSFGVAAALDPQTGMSTGPAQGGDIVLLKNFDSATPKLLEAAFKGQHLPEVTIEWTRTDGGRIMQVNLKEVIISAVNYGTAQEGVSLAWRGMEMIYTKYNTDGTAAGNITMKWSKTTGAGAW